MSLLDSLNDALNDALSEMRSLSQSEEKKRFEEMRGFVGRLNAIEREQRSIVAKLNSEYYRRPFGDPAMETERRRIYQSVFGPDAEDGKESTSSNASPKKVAPPKESGTGDRTRSGVRQGEEDAKLLQELFCDCERLERMSDDMQKLYGGSKGIQRLQKLTADDPKMGFQSVEQMMLDSRIRELASIWREYKRVQAKYADPAYDDHPFKNPEQEYLRKARLKRLRALHEHTDAYNALEALAAGMNAKDSEKNEKGSERDDPQNV